MAFEQPVCEGFPWPDWWRLAVGPTRLAEVRAVERRVFRRDADYQRISREPKPPEGATLDYLFGRPGELETPAEVFGRLRWGGQFIFTAPTAHEVELAAQRFHGRDGFVLDHVPGRARTRLLGMPIGRSVHFFVARKVCLIEPGKTTDRFTFTVHLTRIGSDRYIVSKQVPSMSWVAQRLRERFPEASYETVADRARKLVDHVFPVFLTREAGMLRLLERDLPPEYRHRVPHLLSMDKDERGMVRRLTMNWMRVGGPPLSQLEFAKQSADLLRVLHDVVGIIHLDLRLDNFVITPNGVGFVDFGSAVRIGENLAQSPMLRALFDEMMSTSQIQRVLGHMSQTGRVTSQFLSRAHQKIDRAADLFYLALQMSKPISNPELRHLIRYDPRGEEAKRVCMLTDAILRPKDPDRPRFISAREILGALKRIEERLSQGAAYTARQPAPQPAVA